MRNGLHHRVAAQCGRTPDAVAVRHGDARQTYAELARRVDAIADALRAAGVGPGAFVAVRVERGLDLPASLLGVLATGAAYVPLDPAFPARRIDAILEDSGAVAVLRGDGIERRAPRAGVDAASADAAYLIYTSGSTGAPKGVVVTHANVLNFLDSMAREPGLTSGDVLLAVTTIAFDIAGLELFGPLTVGATVVIADRDDAMDGDRLAALIARHRANVMQATPATWRLLLGADWRAPRGFRALCGGEALPADLAAALLEREVELWNLYGPTETTIWSTIHHVRDARAPVPIGRPIAATSCHVLDEHGRDAETGELWIGGAGVAHGYHGRPELTARAFVDDPARGRLYRTGDLARRRGDGVLECLGRIDHQIKLRGFRIEPGEIEAALREHAAVRDAACGVRDGRLVAWVETVLDAEPLREHVARRLPEYMVPQRFVRVDALPRLISGKLDRKALPDPFVPNSSFEQPGNALERSLAAIWRDVLKLDGPIALDARFFEVGGTSLLALEVLSRLRTALGTRVPITKLFAAPTIASFARMLERDYAPETAAWLHASPITVSEPVIPRAGAAAARIPGTGSDTVIGAPIAIVGIACRTPGARDAAEFWDMIRAGREGIRDLADADLDAAGVPRAEREHPAYVRRGGVLEDAYAFDAEFFGMSPREAELTDPQHRVLLECAWHALEDAGIPPGGATRVGVYVGVAHNHYFDRAVAGNAALRWGDSGFQTQLGADKDYAASRIAFKLDLRGPALALQTACSSSGVAIHLACQALRAGDCDAALAGGARINAPDAGYVHVDGGPQAVDGVVRPFDASASGMVLTSGVACVVLKTLSRAQADGDRVYAVIKGSAINNDGADKVAFTAPSEAGQLDAIRRALRAANVDPATVGYVEAHGTGTHLGDPIEVAALAQGYEAAERIALGSVKSNVGHLDAGAGAIGLIKAALALHDRVLPPSIHCAEPNPECAFERTPFFVNTQLRDWPSDGPRRAALSSFGFGGTNFHAVLEEAPRAEAPARPARAAQLLRLSARTDAALARQARALADWLRAKPEADLADVAWTLATGRALLPRRAAVVARDHAQAIERLEAVDRAGGAALDAPGVVMMFPGQGAQYAGMGAELWRDEPAFRDAMRRCADALAPALGLDLCELLYGGDPSADAKLRETRLAQPAIFAVSWATATLWRGWGIDPVAAVGHSLGELVAATLAGVFELDDALALVAQRGALMQAMPDGGMLAVRLEETEAAKLLRDGIGISGVNAPSLTVLSGPRDALLRLQRELDARGVAATALATSHAFHSRSMEAAAERFAEAVAKVRSAPARMPVVSTLTGRFVAPDELRDPRYWARQIREPVRFLAAARTLLATPDRVFLECGPGRGLAGAVQQAAAGASRAVAIASLPSDARASALDALLGAAGRLHVAGVAVDPGPPRRRVSLPGYPFARTRYALSIVPAEAAAPIEVAPKAAAPPIVAAAADPMIGYVVDVLRGLTGRTFEPDQLDATFLELGLDSLVLMQLASRIKTDLHTELRFRSLLEEHTSVRALAQALQ